MKASRIPTDPKLSRIRDKNVAIESGLTRAINKKLEAPLGIGKPVVRLGRKTTDQVTNLRAGLPKRDAWIFFRRGVSKWRS
jgi:hypothetical protein